MLVQIAWNTVPSLVSSGLQGVSVFTGRRGTGGESWQGRAPGAQCHGPEGGEAWPEAEAPTGKCPLSHDHACAVHSSDVYLQGLGDMKASCRALLLPPFFESTFPFHIFSSFELEAKELVCECGS